MSLDEAFLGCPLCCRSLHVPKLLPCMHIFCRKCLRNHVDKTKHLVAKDPFRHHGDDCHDSGYSGDAIGAHDEPSKHDDGGNYYEIPMRFDEAVDTSTETPASSQNSSLERSDTIYENEDSYVTAASCMASSRCKAKAVTIPAVANHKPREHKPSISSLDIEIPADDLLRKPSITTPALRKEESTQYLNMGEVDANAMLYVNADQAAHQRATYKHWTIRNSNHYEDLDQQDSIYDVPRSTELEESRKPDDEYLSLDTQAEVKVQEEEEAAAPPPPPLMRVRRKGPVEKKPEKLKHNKSRGSLPPLPKLDIKLVPLDKAVVHEPLDKAVVQKPLDKAVVHEPLDEAVPIYEKAVDVITPTNEDSYVFPCPVCEKVIDVPVGGVEQFKTCGLVKTMQEMFVSQKKGKPLCANCESKNARYKCLDCKKYLCTGCHEAHHWRKASRKHKVMSLSGTLSASKKRETDSHSAHCNLHRRKPSTHLCSTCNHIICYDCLKTDHSRHVCQTIENCATRDRDYLQSAMLGVGAIQADMESKGKELKEYSVRCATEKKKVLAEVAKQRSLVLKKIEQAYTEITKQVEEEFKTEQKRVEAIEQEVRSSQMRLEQGVAFAENLLKFGRDGDLADASHTLFQGLNEVRHMDTKHLQNELHINFQPDQSAIELLKPFIGEIHAEQIVITGNQPEMNNTDESTQPPILSCKFQPKTFKDQKGCKPTGIAALPNGSILIVDDINKKLKQFDQQGHLLWECAPSDEHAFVDPWDVAVTKEGNYAVTDRSLHLVKMFDRNGEFINEFGSMHLQSAWGIACDSRGRIIVTDATQKSVLVFDSVGTLLFTISNRDRQLFKCPEYVTVNSNDDIIVSDFDKHCILVFDPTGRMLFTFGQKGAGALDFNVPCGVCTDSDTNILVADYTNQRITKLTRNGEFLSHLATRKHGLILPQALIMTPDLHLVVLDRSDVKVFRFTVEEESVEQTRLSLEMSVAAPVFTGDDDNVYDVPTPSANAKRPYYTDTLRKGRASLTALGNESEQLYINLSQGQTSSVETT
ncbi:hypothetical protein CAPTEDRAFT_227568, partial [Capitella teleta]